MAIPQKPSKLSFWMGEHGRPNQLKVDYIPTGDDTAETIITLTFVPPSGFGGKPVSIKIRPGDFSTVGRWDTKEDVFLDIDHASVMDWTDAGRKRLDEWRAFVKREAKDLAEFERLKAKFAPSLKDK